jgi:hypothetical protein
MTFTDEITGDLVTYWKTVPGITSLVGTTTSARIFPDIAKQGTASPFIVYEEAQGSESYRDLTATTNKQGTVLHVYCYAVTRSGANALADAVRTGTENYRGTMGTATVNDSRLVGFDSGVDVSQDGSDQRRYWTRLIFEIVHSY